MIANWGPSHKFVMILIFQFIQISYCTGKEVTWEIELNSPFSLLLARISREHWFCASLVEPMGHFCPLLPYYLWFISWDAGLGSESDEGLLMMARTFKAQWEDLGRKSEGWWAWCTEKSRSGNQGDSDCSERRVFGTALTSARMLSQTTII